MNRITADRGLFQCYRGVFVSPDSSGETHTPSGESSAHRSASQLEVGIFGCKCRSHFGTLCIWKSSEPPREEQFACRHISSPRRRAPERPQ